MYYIIKAREPNDIFASVDLRLLHTLNAEGVLWYNLDMKHRFYC